MIVVTGDTEWSPIEVVAHVREILDEYGIRATFFRTNEQDRTIGNHELAIHNHTSPLQFDGD